MWSHRRLVNPRQVSSRLSAPSPREACRDSHGPSACDSTRVRASPGLKSRKFRFLGVTISRRFLDHPAAKLQILTGSALLIDMTFCQAGSPCREDHRNVWRSLRMYESY